MNINVAAIHQKMHVLLLITGNSGVGKDTIATRIKDHDVPFELPGYLNLLEFEIYHLADPVKQIAAKCMGYEERYKNAGHREKLINLTAVIQEIDEKFFLRPLLHKLKHGHVIVPDFRYKRHHEILAKYDYFKIITVRVISNSRGTVSAVDEQLHDLITDYTVTN